MRQIDGKSVIINSTANIAKRKGITPRKMVVSGVSLATPAMTYTFRPTGGVINAASTMSTATIPNQTGSKPSLVITGRRMGIVSISIGMDSIRQPKTRKKRSISPRMAYRDTSSPAIKSAKRVGIRDRAKRSLKIKAEIMITKSMQTTWAVDLRLFRRTDQVNFLLANAITKRPLAPTAPASVGVKNPRYMPPITRKKMTNAPQTFFRANTLSFQLNLS
jgi:hypothetical protein